MRIKKLLLSSLMIFSLVTSIKAELIQQNEIIPEFHEVIVTKTSNINLDGDIKKDFIFFGSRESWASQYDFSKTTSAKAGMVALSFFVGGMSGQAWNEMLNNNQYMLIYDMTNNKNEKTRIIGFFAANDFSNDEIIKNYLEEKIKKEIR